MSLLSQTEQDQVAEAIRNAEAQTDAELVTVLARQSDDYSYIPLLWAGMMALILPGAINYYSGWLGMHQLILSQWSLFIILALLFRLPFFGPQLVPKSVRHWRASNMARRQFLQQNLHHTKGETGMLIFVSETERYVEILVDRGISAKIPDSQWQSIVARFTQQVKEGKTLDGFLHCIASCGEELGRALPASQTKNELPNHLVILD
ncbi:putative membrane protein [Spongiibacter sp. IMCC21906]|jgi:putative membrane protein|uniref:TPM domain-containing protein n=1 Tax=Spongiibacter sp. IMCC21906 TaxID=1620392 RepID=UPI00062DF000|nr:TPM domain-containing protein [Spongiibacter sp. IMCC21906]AKH68060.1 putative membrane protein [Spongiibacter sp. IMCC21906]